MARELTNQLVCSLPNSGEYEQYNGIWSIKGVSRIDGKPAAVILYPKDMPQALDELRPWCACGVRVFLGMLYEKDEGKDTLHTTLSFLLIPPGAVEKDCPSKRSNQKMRNA